MNLIKLLDVANPRSIKDTINALIQNTESFEARIGPIAEHAETVAEQALESSAAVATAAAQAVVDSKVDKITGKGLSTNDLTNELKAAYDDANTKKHTHTNKEVLDLITAAYTTEEKTKLGGIEAGAEVNILEIIKVNNTALTPTNKAVNIDLTAYALISETGNKIVLELDSTNYKITAKLKDKNDNVISTSAAIDLPLESVVVNGTYDSTNQKIVLTLQNGNTIDVPVGALVSGLQSEITSSNKLDADLVDDATSANKFVTAQEKTKIADALTSETDPTVSSWAKQPNKPTYSYSEITNTPTIPTVNDSTIVITQGGVEKGRFTLNQASGDTIVLDAGGQQNVVSDSQVDDTSVVTNGVSKLYTKNGDYNASTNKFVTENDLPDVSVKVDKVSTTNKLYGTDGNGSQTTYGIGISATNIPQYDANARLQSATPSGNTDVTNKKYVDDNFVDLTSEQTISGNKTISGTWKFSDYATSLTDNTHKIKDKDNNNMVCQLYGFGTDIGRVNAFGSGFANIHLHGNASRPRYCTGNNASNLKEIALLDDVAAKQDTLTFDPTPTQNSNNPVTSGGIYSAIEPNFVELYTNSEIRLTANTWTNVGNSASLTLKNSSGNKLTFENYAVKIGAGVSKVRVYAKGRFYCNTTNTRLQVALKKNGGSAGGNVDYSSSDCKMQYVQFQVDFECIVNVSANDELTFSVMSSNSNSSNKDGLQTNSAFIVEVVE